MDRGSPRTLVGLMLVSIAAVSWGTTGSTLQLVGATSTAVPFVVGASRMLVAAVLLIAGARVAGASLRPTSAHFALAGLWMAAYQVFFFSAVPLAGVAATALLAICSAPILITVLAFAFLGEALNPSRILALALGVAGAGLLVGAGSDRATPHFLVGSALALGAGLAYSLYAVTTKSALKKSPPLGLAALTFAVAAFALLPVFALEPATAAHMLERSWPLLLYLGAIPTAAAYWLYTTGLRRIPAGSAAIAGLLEPLTATALGLALFHERFMFVQVLGAGLLLAAMGMLTLAATRDYSEHV